MMSKKIPNITTLFFCFYQFNGYVSTLKNQRVLIFCSKFYTMGLVLYNIKLEKSPVTVQKCNISLQLTNGWMVLVKQVKVFVY